MTTARDLSNIVGTLSRQGLNKPNCNPIIINGDMAVQEHGINQTLTGLGDGDEGYVLHDRMRHTITAGAGRFTLAQAAITDLSEHRNALHIDVTTADASLSTTSSVYNLDYRIEGFDIATLLKWGDTSNDSSAEYITLAFYMKTDQAYTFTVGLINSDHSRHIRRSFTTTTSWTKHIITFPPDIGNSPNSDIGEGLRLRFTFSAGSDFTSGTLATDWESTTSANAHVGGDNIFASTDGDIKLTGLQMEIGQYDSDSIPNFLYNGDRTLDYERCQRYAQLRAVENNQAIGHGNAYSSTILKIDTMQRGQMRTSPTIVQNTNNDDIRWDSENSFDTTDTVTGTEFGSIYGITLNCNSASAGQSFSLTQGSYCRVYGGTSTVKILMSSEL